MYNLFVTAAKGQWDKSAYEIDLSRFLEHTDRNIVEKYKILDDSSTSELISFPSLFVYEDGVEGDARLGRLIRIKPRDRVVRFEFELDNKSPLIPHALIVDLRTELDINKSEFSRTHWAVKDIDLLSVLSKKRIIGLRDVERYKKSINLVVPDLSIGPKKLSIHPSVFKIPAGSTEDDLVSVMMPLSIKLEPVYRTLIRACAKLDLRCQRADSIWDESEVIQDIFSLIYRSRIVICDFSGNNRNVFYEAGIAHTLGKPVIPILQNQYRTPFDLTHHRYLKYINDTAGRRELAKGINRRLQQLVR